MNRRLLSGHQRLTRSFKITALVVSLAGFATSSAAVAETVAFVGDSISTGAVTHPSLVYDRDRLWKVFANELSVEPSLDHIRDDIQFELGDLRAPVRLWPVTREYQGSLSWIGLHMMIAASGRYLDTEQYSWSYLLARRMGYAPEQILIGAQDGARSQDIVSQLSRVLNANGGQWPERVFVFFSGNDLCGHIRERIVPPAEFRSNIDNGLRLLAEQGAPAPGGTKIYLVSFMSILQISQRKEITSKTVMAHGKLKTCKEVADTTQVQPQMEGVSDTYKALILFQLPATPVAMCQTVFMKNPDRNKDQLTEMANFIRSYRKASRELVKDYNRRDIAGLSFQFIEGPGKLNFDAPDIAQDCFHLSVKGQAKVMNSVFEEIH